jgi:hypothetical protein
VPFCTSAHTDDGPVRHKTCSSYVNQNYNNEVCAFCWSNM